jgi:hypothetical protein
VQLLSRVFDASGGRVRDAAVRDSRATGAPRAPVPYFIAAPARGGEATVTASRAATRRCASWSIAARRRRRQPGVRGADRGEVQAAVQW